MLENRTVVIFSSLILFQRLLVVEPLGICCARSENSEVIQTRWLIVMILKTIAKPFLLTQMMWRTMPPLQVASLVWRRVLIVVYV